MATWVTHLMVADNVLKKNPFLCRHEFCVGNIAPDCNVENEDWTNFTPSREVTHWMDGKRKNASDCDRFLQEYLEKKTNLDRKEASFLLGYYAHLITDAEFQRFTRDEERVRAVWNRIKKQPELKKAVSGLYRLFTPRGNCAENKGDGIYAAKRGGTISIYRIFQRGICSVCKQCHAAGDRGNRTVQK